MNRRGYSIGMLLILCVGLALILLIAPPQANTPTPPDQWELPDWIEPAIIDVDGASRRGIRLDGVNDIVIHYVGNPGSTARANRNWFNSANSTVSSHFIVGLDGEILQCVPLDEVSSASNHRNHDTISIEVCHPDDTGVFNDATYAALVKLTAWLARQADLTTDHLIRHHDVTGKECPRWFVRDPAAWETFKNDVAQALENTKAPS